MKHTLLIEHRWKTLGWILSVPALIAGIYLMYMDSPDDYLQVVVPHWLDSMLWIDSGFGSTGDSPTTISLLDELICICLLLGLLLLAFSKEKIEDEWIQQVRLESLQWAILVNTILLIIFTIFMHGFVFMVVMELNMFTPLLVFVARFYYILRIKPSFSKQ